MRPDRRRTATPSSWIVAVWTGPLSRSPWSHMPPSARSPRASRSSTRSNPPWDTSMACSSRTAPRRLAALQGWGGRADELFAADTAHLVAVDHRSLLLLALRQVAHCDTPAWAETWRHVKAQGVEV